MKVICTKDYTKKKKLFNGDRFVVMRGGNTYTLNLVSVGEINIKNYAIFYGEDKKWHEIHFESICEFFVPAEG